jgi:hypothetical protein
MIDKAIEVAGPIPTLLDSRATIRLALGDPKGALTDVEESLASRPVAVAFFHQAQVERKLGKGPAGKVSLEKAKELGLRVVELHPLERPIYQQMQNEVR